MEQPQDRLEEVIHARTGEVMQIRASRAKGGRYAMPGGYGIVSLVYVSRLLEMKLGAGLEIVLYLMSQSDYTGLTLLRNGEVARAIGMNEKRVSTHIRRLHRMGVLHRVGPQTVFFNPAYFFRGSPTEQRSALDRWARYRRDLIQPAKAA